LDSGVLDVCLECTSFGALRKRVRQDTTLWQAQWGCAVKRVASSYCYVCACFTQSQHPEGNIACDDVLVCHADVIATGHHRSGACTDVTLHVASPRATVVT
jgi:hypothetical protein